MPTLTAIVSPVLDDGLGYRSGYQDTGIGSKRITRIIDSEINGVAGSSSTPFRTLLTLTAQFTFRKLVPVRVIRKPAILRFADKHPDALVPLMNWYRITRKADWGSLADVRNDFAHADLVGRRTVCNIQT
jgi:hypothetical protein